MTINQLIDRIYERRMPFLAVFFVVVLLTYGVLYVIDFYPEPKTEVVQDDVQVEETLVYESATETEDLIIEKANGSIKPDPSDLTLIDVTYPEPVKIIFDELNNKEIKVLNPASNTIAALDEALLSGVVRHPDSADFDGAGNIFILGHSSYLPNVLNKNFQAFNGIQKLEWGDKIRLQSADTEYVYKVEKVYEAKAADIFVPHTPGEARLTLATCDVLGSKEDRFMVEAVLIGSYDI